MPQLRDGRTVDDPRLDRLPHFDERSRLYPVTDRLGADAQILVSRTWKMPAGAPVLDQGSEGACVGFGVTNELRANPVPVPGLDATFAHDTIYWGAQKTDPWPGGSYPGATPVYEGSSVLAGMKTAADLGYYGEYRWAFSEQELALAVGHLGPSVIGINWYQGMMQPDGQGFLNPTGSLAGGHCILVIAVNVRSGYYTLYNSWGPGWGKKGTARVRRTAMSTLLSQDGEAAIITERSIPTSK